MHFRFSSLRNLIESGALALLAVLIALTPVSSKAINLAWILVVVMVIWLLARSSKAKDLPHDLHDLRTSLALLSAFFVGGLLLKIGMQLFWGEPVRGVAFEMTAAAAAGASWAMVAQWRTKPIHLSLLAGALLVASGLAILQAYGYTYAGHAGPTNAVNWGAGLALFMCIALAISVHGQANRRDRWMLVLSLLGLSLALIVAGRRGAFFAILWAVAWGVYFWIRGARNRGSMSIRVWSPFLVVIPILTIALTSTKPLPAPVQRIVATVEEVSLRLGGGYGSGDVSSGTLGPRFYQYEQGLKAGAASPVWGLGAEGRSRLIKIAEADLAGALFHMHNEYLQAWVAYGIPGLVGALCFPVGLVVVGWRLRGSAHPLSLALTGMGAVHFVSGLTNVNTFHNYYTSVFAVAVVVPFLLLRSVPLDSNAPSN
ncbi:O-antigen ligase [Hydrogenophaga sp.]|uniref:O-antigen ligase family protein n=1 Tax=Hydrogenophaga sp. TaxID=1904254 RepID=UPI00260AD2ED|nr:O-antigen ligase family protein [Hydrogenophaga sp.]MDM7950136.1 O-antigen ligase family protein [Hydrogenophaga sp.]